MRAGGEGKAGLSGRAADLAFSVAAQRGSRTIIDIPVLDLAAGEMTALSGPSGSGKSTLLYLLAGLLKPGAGSVAWDGREISAEREAARDRWRLENSGFVFQTFNLIEELSPLENVLAPAWFGRFGGSAMRKRAVDLLERFGVPHQRRRTDLLSNGEQQRVAIARALLLDPKIIFADEPTASLDAAAGEAVGQALADLAQQGRTVVVASHDPALLARASRVIRLDHGRVAAQAVGAVA